MPLLVPDETDRLTHDSWKSKDDTRYSDYTQFLNWLTAIDEWFTQDHNGTTGKHTTGKKISQWANVVSGSSVAMSAHTSAGGVVYNHNMGSALTGIFLRPLLWGAKVNSGDTTGIMELMNVYAEGASNHEGSPNLSAWGIANGNHSEGVFAARRMSAWTGSNAGLTAWGYWPRCLSPEIKFKDAADELSYSGEAFNKQQFRAHTALVSDFNRADTVSLYRQCWRIAKAIVDCLRVEHNASTMISEAPNPMRLAGRLRMEPTSVGVTATYATQINLVALHGGTFYYAIPWIVGAESYSYTFYEARIGYDDIGAYLITQRLYDSVQTSSHHCVLFKESIPNIGALPALSLTNLVSAQGFNIRKEHWQQLRDGLVRYYQLIQAEHDFASGCHRYAIDSMNGATKVLDTTVTAPSNVANMTYTGGGGGGTAVDQGTWHADSYNQVTRTLIEAHQANNPVYFMSLIGNAGSGIVCPSIAVNKDNVYLQLRRHSTGSTNTFSARVWRVNGA